MGCEVGGVVGEVGGIELETVASVGVIFGF